jgi:hypothetical protein
MTELTPTARDLECWITVRAVLRDPLEMVAWSFAPQEATWGMLVRRLHTDAHFHHNSVLSHYGGNEKDLQVGPKKRGEGKVGGGCA